ncbi:MAG: EamA family transporter [uncultured Campylobacterales bacterium]|uniref:EamA family transporter n=1 Tax=uncultured Campylobacterales bacterium TaxID=352960 RepID=A0A6S6SZ65_9BACT|nr:MAG: EamA family transporter [uncultured Campylobacterales bacterium]
MKKERQGEYLALGLAMIESCFPILSIVSMSYIGAINTYAYSLVVALFFLTLLMLKRKKFNELKNTKEYKSLVLTTFWITSLFLLVFIGMRYTTAGNMAVIIFLQLLFSYLYFNVFGKEKMQSIHLLGAIFMGIGALTILVPDELTFNKGDLLILLGAMISPIANYYQKQARTHYSTETILSFRTVVALPFVFILAFIFEPTITYENFLKALPYILTIGVLVYVISKIMWIEALYRISITKLSAMIALIPVMTLILAYFYLNEIPSVRQILGVLPVLLGGYLITREVK